MRYINLTQPVLVWLATVLVACQVGCGQTKKDGFIKKSYVDESGQTSHYVVYVPPNAVEKSAKLPVILFLNGWGENGEDGLRQISNNFGSEVWRMRGYFPFLAVCPQCSPNGDWSPGSPNAAKALATLDLALAEYGGDPNRICITGASVGGMGALALAAAHPERFASVAPVAAGGISDAERLASADMPVWCFYNSGDVVAESAREFRRQLISAGASPRFTEYQGEGHNAWDAAYASPALYHWMLQADSSKRRKDRFSLVPTNQLLANVADSQAAAGWQIDDASLTVNPAEPDARARLVSQLVGKSASLHFDVYLSNGDVCVLDIACSVEGTDSASLAKMTLETSNVGRHKPIGFDYQASLPIATHALNTGWNEVRIDLDEQALNLFVNGWPLLTEPPSFDADEHKVAIELFGESGRLKNFRVSRQRGDE